MREVDGHQQMGWSVVAQPLGLLQQSLALRMASGHRRKKQQARQQKLKYLEEPRHLEELRQPRKTKETEDEHGPKAALFMPTLHPHNSQAHSAS